MKSCGITIHINDTEIIVCTVCVGRRPGNDKGAGLIKIGHLMKGSDNQSVNKQGMAALQEREVLKGVKTMTQAQGTHEIINKSDYLSLQPLPP